MIKVVIDRQHENIHAFEISGHANSGPYGYDLVCAGVSAVSFGAVNAVLDLCDIELKIEQGKKGGFLYVELLKAANDEEFKKAQLILEAMIVSLQTIERDYKPFIEIKEVPLRC